MQEASSNDTPDVETTQLSPQEKNLSSPTKAATQDDKGSKPSGVTDLYAFVILTSLFFIFSMKDVLGSSQDYATSFSYSDLIPKQYIPYIQYNQTTAKTTTSLQGTVTEDKEATEPKEPHHSAAMCVIQKSTLKYFEEWILYHTAIGYEHFYMYDNADEPEVKDWVEKQSQEIQDRVTVKHFPGVKQQVKAYLDCWSNIRDAKSHSWIAFFDVDEYVVIKDLQKYPKIMDLLDSLPAHQYGLAVNWINFGLSGHMKYEDKPVTLRFQNRSETESSFVVKSMVRSQVSPKMKNPHYIKYKLTKTKSVYMSRDSRGNVVQGPENMMQEVRDIALYHYASKSLEEYKDRCARGDVLRGQADWSGMVWCKSDQEILDQLQRDEPVFDDRPWKLLQERVPEYTKKYTT
ncbi:MAG: hypothetical protein SGBAC_013218, partial [Bacillariaceae sp.]